MRNIRILSSFFCNIRLTDGTDTVVNIVLYITSLVDKQVLSLEKKKYNLINYKRNFCVEQVVETFAGYPSWTSSAVLRQILIIV